MKFISINRRIHFIHILTILAFCLFALAPFAFAQAPDRIVKQAETAMGGEKNLRRIRSWQASGVITRGSDGAKGSYRMAMTRPDLYSLSIEIGGFEVGEGFNGKSGWRRDSRAGLRTLTGIEANQFRAEALFHNNLWLNYKNDKSKLSSSGQDQVNGKPAQVLILTTNRDVKIKMWFDQASRLLVKEELPAGNGFKTIEYSDHRSVNGVMEPFTIKLNGEGEQFLIALDQVTHNTPIDRAAFDFPKHSGEPLPDIGVLLKQVSDNQAALDELLEKYTYSVVITSRDFDKNGILKAKESKKYEATFYRGHRLRRLVAKNEQPLSAEEQAKEDKRIEKLIREIEKQGTEREKNGEEDKDYQGDDRRFQILEFLRVSNLINPRRERYRQRDCVVFDFEPNLAYKAKKDSEKILQKLSGAIWIDANDRQVTRVEAKLVDSYKIGGGTLASIKPGGAIVLEQDRINNEIWLPTYAEINISARIFMMAGLTINTVAKYGDYQRFNVEAEKEKLKDPVKANPPNRER